ncbi:penicillin-binding protein 1C [Aliivibrio sp. S3MY1]|uniref:penicillin-binding protein 1C n=1 Tax=unclassified Aliivibrio TaxID=2645654 RepID=UPI002377E1CB|nr:MULTISPECIES: penicillin-binding protein 1C [unclassified Aliivibrio]MDD9194241.1 penicillin-binding protein 1C [Aliivibrio sp. S3MY1]MDD9197908.1 penicillin-binding protein 1C [Aliivibrio sp. S2MY1]
MSSIYSRMSAVFQQHSFFHWIRRAIITIALLLISAFFIAHYLSPLDLKQRLDSATTIYSKNGEVLRQFANSKGTYRLPITHTEQEGRITRPVSSDYLTALLEYEDKYFYYHPGVNPFSLIRAMAQHAVYGEVISGGSTLTMQVARMFYPYKRSYRGKIEQIFRALQIEWHFSKEEILDLYLTHTPMGGNIEGVESASRRYFGKSANDLNTTEAILLVVLPQRPSATRPDRYPDRALAARNKVLIRTQHALKISDQALQDLLGAPLEAKRYYQDTITPLLARHLASATPQQRTFHTFIDHTLQYSIDKLIRQTALHWPNRLSSAIIVMDNATGHVIAYKGSADFSNFERYGHVNMALAIRSPGSTLKPFIYGLALEQNMVHSGSLLMDIPHTYGDYQPQNFNRYFSGPIRLDTALQLSKNAPVVQVLNHVGADRFIDLLEKTNLTFDIQDANLTIALGGIGTNLTSLVSLYSSLARHGKTINPRYTESTAIQETNLLSPAASWILFDTLSKIPPPNRFSAAHHRQIAWKTGTSYGFRDAWSIGVSAQYTVGVWVGRPDGAPNVGKTGAKQAAPIMFDIFDQLPPESIDVMQPDTVKQHTTCWPSGLLNAQVKEQDCLLPQPAFVIDEQAPPTLRMRESYTNLHQWPAPLQQWSLSQNRPLTTKKTPEARPIKILAPENNTHFFPYIGQRITLTSTYDTARWFIDDTPLTTTSLSFDDLKTGQYRLTTCSQQCDSVIIHVSR